MSASLTDGELTPDEQRAWEIYCAQGTLHAVDFWHELSPRAQAHYLARARAAAKEERKS